MNLNQKEKLALRLYKCKSKCLNILIRLYEFKAKRTVRLIVFFVLKFLVFKMRV